ncbi:MAG: lipoprotein [Burkholderiales bacterium]
MRYDLMILTLAFLAGCGTKGALFLPEKESEAAPGEPATTQQPAATQDLEQDRDQEPAEEQEDEDDVNL